MRKVNTQKSIIIATAIGALCAPVFQLIYGIVANFDVEHKFIRWITIMPMEYRLSAATLHSFMIEMITAILITAVAGLILGYLVKRNSLLFGCMATIAYFACGTIYLSILSGHFIFSRDGGNTLYTICSTVAWILLFIIMTRIGILLNNKLQSRQGDILQ
jgi:hypothetical protein